MNTSIRIIDNSARTEQSSIADDSTGWATAPESCKAGRLPAIVAGLWFVALVAGCSADADDKGSRNDIQYSGDPATRYGYAPTPDPNLDYNPDVAIVAGGSTTIKSVSPDGLVWTIDASAAGASDLRPGKIMFATAEALGRIVKIEPAGTNLAVTLAPVGLGEVIRNGRLTFDGAVDLGSMAFSATPEMPGGQSSNGQESTAMIMSALTTPGTNDGPTTIVVPTIALANPGEPGATEAKTKAGDWELTAYKDATTLGMKGDRAASASNGLKVSLDVYLTVENLRVFTEVPVNNGVVGASRFRIEGIKAIGVKLAAGASEGVTDNRKVKFEIPIEIKRPFVVGGLPAVLRHKFTFLVETAFSAKNGNISADGLWLLDGPIGLDGTTVTAPAFSTSKSLLDSLEGVSPGVNGIVVAGKFQFAYQLGIPLASAGPFAQLIVSVGLTNGSSLALVQCRQTTIVLSASAGVGVTAPDGAKKAIEKLLGVPMPPEPELLKKEIANLNKWAPDVQACRP